MLDPQDPQTHELIRRYRIGREYLLRLADAGLDDPKDGFDIDDYMKKQEIQAELHKTYPDLPIFFFDKVETKHFADALVEDLTEEYGGTHGFAEEDFWRRYWGRPNHDRDLPEVVLSLIEQGVFNPRASRRLLEHAWVHTEFPAQNAEPERWIDAFRTAGWVSDDESIPPPGEPILLYRGAEPKYAFGMSWTTDPVRAKWFAKRWGADGEVFSATIYPDVLLAKFFGRGEFEYVVDPVGIFDVTKIEEKS